jgi:hypothetical protein
MLSEFIHAGPHVYGRLPALIASLCKLNHVLFGRKKVIASTHYQHWRAVTEQLLNYQAYIKNACSNDKSRHLYIAFQVSLPTTQKISAIDAYYTKPYI